MHPELMVFVGMVTAPAFSRKGEADAVKPSADGRTA
jgi:hypothetical protein